MGLEGMESKKFRRRKEILLILKETLDRWEKVEGKVETKGKVQAKRKIRIWLQG